MQTAQRQQLINGFHQASLSLTQAVSNRGINSESATRLAAKIESLADAQLPQLSKTGMPLACAPKCCHCCHQMIFATPPELIRIHEYINLKPVIERSIIADRVQNYNAAVEQDASESYQLAREPCPFLADDLCSIYEVRPLMCRGLSSVDASVCSDFRKYPWLQPDIGPHNGEIRYVSAGANGILKGLRTQSPLNTLMPMSPTLGHVLERDENIQTLIENPVLLMPKVERRWIRFFPPPKINDPLGPFNRDPNWVEFIRTRRLAPLMRALPLVSKASTANLIARISVPSIYKSPGEIPLWRSHFERAIEDALAAKNWNPRDAYYALEYFRPIGIGYQPGSVRAPMELIGKLLNDRIAEPLAPDLLLPLGPRKPGPIRVGIASDFGDNSASSWTLGWVQHMDRAQFEVTALKVSGSEQAPAFHFRRLADKYYKTEGHPIEIARFIRSLDLDYLIFSDLGDDGNQTQLAIFRLARRQAAAWGCPFTTGLHQIDDYLSSDLMEPSNAQSEYSENLVRLPNSGLTLEPLCPTRLQHKTRSDFGLPEGFLVTFPQYVIKWLPQWDEVLAEIVVRSGNPLVVFGFDVPYETEVFKSRMARLGVPLHWVERTSAQAFRRILQLCDVALDSPSWSGGITAINALASGVPFAIHPGEHLRERLAMAFAEMSGAPSLVASNTQEYIDIASSSERLQSAMRTINPDAMFNDMVPLRALEDHIRSTIQD